ncbi:MAG: UDP-N-acetylglucosamine 2-epimerase (non-hydrolyzing) [Planctomycetaceae bacterium]|jgi:UDP-N-acetylglucosamine 2-epimerase (non-hydrolysing)|nr:UDP-N-acetylglucosamine 2-epimerase (non-hydrolyzing) [Planctomycetaceae bacterium]
MNKISFIFGTRPEAIKLCPLILTMQKTNDKLMTHVCVTGQHREMLAQVLDVFGITPDIDLELMQPNQTLANFTSRAIATIDHYLTTEKPDMVIVQGDTTSVFCASLVAFYHQIPIGHVEAGLRTWNKWSPFPEEINRVLTTRIADLHFAPTLTSKNNLLKEGIEEKNTVVTGNTVIDALLIAVEQVKKQPPVIPNLPNELQPKTSLDSPPLVLITGHRRENFGGGFENICHAITELAKQFPQTHFVYPVHLNPNVREPVNRILRTNEFVNIHLIEPLSYLPFVAMMNRSTLILTDSGGVQEEAPSLGKPVLVMRDTTERPEAMEMGTVKLVGTNRQLIIDEVNRLLTDKTEYNKMANAVNPYGDGKACERIIEVINCFFNKTGKTSCH